MTYSGKIPSVQEIARLTTLIKDYPTTRADAVRVARMWGLSNEAISFLRLFPVDELFQSRTDLLLRTEKLSESIRHDWESKRVTVTF